MVQKTHVKDIGIEGIYPPEKVCDDKKCPWHGEIRIRGLLFEGKVERIGKANSFVSGYFEEENIYSSQNINQENAS